MSRRRVRGSAVAAAAVLLVACGGGGDDAAPEADAPAVTDAPTTEVPVTDAADDTPVETEPPTSDASNESDGDSLCGIIVGIGDYEPIDCSEPHDAELAGLASTSTDPGTVSEADFTLELIETCSSVVSALTGRPTDQFGIDVSPVHDTAGGDEDNVACWATISTPEALVGSLDEITLDQAIGHYEFIIDMDPGACYLEPSIGFDVGTVGDCSDQATVQLVAVLDSKVTDYDGQAIVDDAFASCGQEIADASFELIGTSATGSVITPYEEGWRALGRRTVICLMERDNAEEIGSGADDFVVDEAQATAAQPCAGTPDDFFPAVACDEPHASEFAGTVPSPVDTLPDDRDEAAILGTRACLETVTAFAGVERLPEGVGAGFSIDSGLGESIVGDLSCFLSTDLPDALLGSIADIGFATAFQKVSVPDTDPGSCFVLGDANFYLADVADCADEDALMFLGSFALDDGDYPGEDEIRAIRAVECARILDESGLPADPDSVSGTFPAARDWVATGDRLVACDATPL